MSEKAVLPHEIAELVRQGKTVEAIRELRAQRKWPLKPALELVQRWRAEQAQQIGRRA